MNGQYYGARFHTSDIVQRNDKDTNILVANSDAYTGQLPVDETPVQEIPAAGPVAVVGPQDEIIVNETPIGETVPYQAPVGETMAGESRVVGQPAPYKAPMGETITHEAPTGANTASPAALLNREQSGQFRTRWNEIQGKFVDEPRAAVLQADALVAEVIEQITQTFTNERSSLEGQWNQGNDASTEDLRKALQRYRAFFNRLVV
jgi:hypothetical protein